MTWMFVLLACTVSAPIPEGKVQEIAKDVLRIGHPNGDFVAARLVDFQAGGVTSNTAERYLDVAIDYTAKKGDHTMTVRFFVDSLEPCKVRTDVIGDDGPKPVLLDNAIASPAVGKRVCEALAAPD